MVPVTAWHKTLLSTVSFRSTIVSTVEQIHLNGLAICFLMSCVLSDFGIVKVKAENVMIILCSWLIYSIVRLCVHLC